MAIKVVTPPASEPLTLAYVKQVLRVEHTAEDTFITNLITAAREWVEGETGRALMAQTLDEVFDCWPACCTLELGRAPLASVTSVSYRDSDGSYIVWDTDNYTVDDVSNPGRIVKGDGVSWPTLPAGYPNGVKIRYVAGNSTAADVPAQIRRAMELLIAKWYEQREDFAQGRTDDPTVFAAKALVQAFRVFY